MKQIPIKYLMFIALVAVGNILISLIFAYVSETYLNNVPSKNTIAWSSATEKFVVAIILAPFLETLLFQLLPYRLISYVNNKATVNSNTADYIFIFIASVLFAFGHQYNWFYVISAFVGGITLNYSYVYFCREKFYPYLSVVTIHALYNLAVFVLQENMKF